MRKAGWVVVACVGLSACAGSSTATSPGAQSTPTAAASTPAPSGTPTSPAPTSTAAAMTRAEYLVKARPICDTVTKIVDGLPEPGNDQNENLKILDQRAAALTEALTRLQALTPPARDAGSVKFIIDHLTAVRDDTSGQAESMRAGDTVRAGQLEARFDGDETIAKNAANEYGLGDCGA